ncbi:glycosyltransferase [Lactobacillus helveticus]|uniref:glycosyltransferase n=1 Tax=Lactobacillus helveticus TaxID=1587 RepID=UPI000F6CC566|nr:glycosyltransferase [Lactobacillus helveticus]AZA22350.1 MAG: glycosyltransferase [Lactobacillus helveticus]MCT3400887.1 glycosyltransferase [Lactobacillus helveticus]NRO86964.1 putative teichuronic acid biosynthesis glycosyltransferase TuaC [Lactobacillus helveticus]
MKKKVLMVCEAFGGGVFTYVRQLCNDMCDNFDIYLAYSLRPQTPKNYKEQLDPRIHLIEVKSWNGKSVTNIINDRKVIKELRQIESRVHPDIIHLHSSIAGGIGRLAFKSDSYKLIYTPHGYAHILMGPGIKSDIYKTIEKYLGKHSKAITLTCTESEDDVARTLSNDTAYIETGIDVKELAKTLNKVKRSENKELKVYTVGRIAKQKRPDLFNKIAELVPNVKFLWIGDGELKNELTSPNITVTGWKDRNEALKIADTADIFILCSYGEAIAMSLIENMYMGKLCLVSDTMGNKSVINNGTNGYTCNTAEDYAKRVKEAVEVFPFRLAKQAHDDVVNIYNNDVMKKKYIKFYKSLIK